jgi:hypothetical protein
MRNKRKAQNILRKLIRTKFYFDLPVPEGIDLMKEIPQYISASHRGPLSFQTKGLYLEEKGKINGCSMCPASQENVFSRKTDWKYMNTTNKESV